MIPRYRILLIAFSFLCFCLSGQTLPFDKIYGGSSCDEGVYACPAINGGYVTFGKTKSFGSGDRDYYMVKTTVAGDTQWTKTFGTTDDEILTSVQKVTGGYVMCGWKNENVKTIYLAKVDTV